MLICIATAVFLILFNNVKAQDLMKGIKPKEVTNSLSNEACIDSLNNFSSDLFISSAENKGNILISPTSIYLALAMTVNGADNDTKDEILNVLADNGIDIQTLNQQSSNLISNLNTSTDKTVFYIKNSIWYDENFSPYEPFLQTNADYYKAGLSKIDFSDKNAPQIINKWVSEATEGKIDNILDKIDSSVVMYLINTIYFKSDWQEPFSNDDTQQITFYTPIGGVKTDFMKKTGSMDYIFGYESQGVLLSYENKKFAYFAIIPDDNIEPREWIKSQNSHLFSNIFDMISNKQTKSMELYMPKFEAKYQDSIINELEQLGINKAFDPGNADLSLMNEQHIKNLYISEVMHKTYFKIDENGTEAAAATSVEVSLTAIPQSDIKLKFDRPFVYGIVDITTNSVIFAGIMENPT